MDFSSYPLGRDPWPNSISPQWHGNSGNTVSDFPHDSSSALSLLSTNPWTSRSQSSSLGINNFLGNTNTTLDVGHDTWPSLGFKGNDNSLHQMLPGLGQIAHPADNGMYPGELGLGQPSEEQFHGLDHSRGYDSHFNPAY